MRRVAALLSATVAAGTAAGASAAVAEARGSSGASPRPLQDPDGLDLVFVQVVTRHGDRTPLRPLPSSPKQWDCTNVHRLLASAATASEVQDILADGSAGSVYRKAYIEGRQRLPGTCHSGQLTLKGVEEHRALGARFRREYVERGFLPPVMDPSLLYIRSTDVPRTIESAQSLLHGLYPPSTRPSGLPPIPIHMLEEARETLWMNTKLCARLEDTLRAIKKSDEYRQRKKEADALREELSKIVGEPVENLPDVLVLHDAIVCHAHHGEPLAHIPDDLKRRLQHAGHWQAYASLAHPDAIRYGLGPFMGELLEQQKAALEARHGHRFALFSAHDSTVFPILEILGVWDRSWPPYASNIVFETLRDRKSGEVFVRSSYNGKALDPPGCAGASPCPLERFRALVNAWVPDLKKECSLSDARWDHAALKGRDAASKAL
eukprot:tig00021357_g20777.t1